MITAVIVSNAINEQLKDMTQRAVSSCGCHEVLVVEQQDVSYEGARVIKNNCETFNYNRALNAGIDEAKGEYIALCNSDLYFYPNFRAIEGIMRVNDIHSASPFCLNQKMIAKSGNHYMIGYTIGKELLGYCIVIDRFVLEKIGRLSEEFEFYFADNAYAEQIQRAGIPHYLLCNVFIDHLHNVTFQTMKAEERRNKSLQKAAEKWQRRTRI